MCGNIKRLRFPDRPATDAEIDAAVLQYVRKISGVREPSADNAEVFAEARKQIGASVRRMLRGLKTKSGTALRTVAQSGFKPIR